MANYYNFYLQLKEIYTLLSLEEFAEYIRIDGYKERYDFFRYTEELENKLLNDQFKDVPTFPPQYVTAFEFTDKLPDCTLQKTGVILGNE